MGRARKAVAAFAGGAIMVTSAWAGASLLPAGADAPLRPAAATPVVAQATKPVTAARTPKAAPAPAPAPSAAKAAKDGAPAFDPASLPAGQVLAGAAKTST